MTDIGNLDVSNEEFLRALFGDDWRGAHVTAFASDPATDGDRGRWAGNLAGRILHTFKPYENAYYVVSLFEQDYADRRGGRATRRKAQFASMHVVVVDDVADGDELGGGRKVKASIVRDRMGEPSFKLMTSPGNEQWGYILDPPIEHRVVGETLVQEMIARGLTADGNDPGMAGVTRYVRLPVGTNRKGKYRTDARPDGFPCRLTAWNPDHKFTAQQIADAWGIDLEATLRAEREQAEEQATRDAAAQAARPAPQVWTLGWPDGWDMRTPHRHVAAFADEDMQREFAGEAIGGEDDTLLAGLRLLGLVGGRGDGCYHLTCPFVHTHTGGDRSGTAFMLQRGVVFCHHGHGRLHKRADYKAEVVKRLRRRGDDAAKAVLATLAPTRKARALNPNPWRGIAEAVRRHDRRAEDPAGERRALFGLAVECARYVSDDLTEAVIGEAVEGLLRDRVSAAEWRLAWMWGLAKAREGPEGGNVVVPASSPSNAEHHHV